MATNSCFKTARLLAIAHIVIGGLLIVFGIADRAIGRYYTGYIYFGIWIGIWVCITGSLGIPGTSRERTPRNKVFAGVFMGFSITSAVFAGIIIITYSLALAYTSDYYSYRYSYRAGTGIAVVILMLGIGEFVVGIWAAICGCYLNSCDCCGPTDPGQQDVQMVYAANPNMPNSGGYMMTQGPGGVPMAVPVQGGGGMVAVQVPPSGAIGSYPQVVPVSGAQTQMVQMLPSGAIVSYPQGVPVSGAQPQMVQVSAPSGAVGGEPQFVQGVATSNVVMGAGQPQVMQVPSGGAATGRYMPLEEEQMPTKQ